MRFRDPVFVLHLSMGQEGWVELVTEVASSSIAQGRLQAAGTQLHDVRAKKDQLAAQIREAQAMLAMDTGMWLPCSCLSLLCAP